MAQAPHAGRESGPVYFRLAQSRHRVLIAPVGLGVASLAIALTVAGIGPAAAAQAPVGLGTAASFAVLAHSTVTNTGPSVVTGNLGVSPGTAVTGFPPGQVSSGSIHSADAVAAQAQNDVTTAYNDAAGRSTTGAVTADLGGQTLVPGVYTGSSLGLTGTLTLDAQNDPTAVFIFQSHSTLITASASSVKLVNGANACNIFWQVASSATFGTNSTFIGTVLALTSVTTDTNAQVTGRLLASNAAVTLDTNNVATPTCSATATTPPTPSPTVTPTATPSSSSTPTAAPSGSSTPSPTASVTPSGSAIPTSSSTPTGGASPTPSATPTAVPLASGSSTPAASTTSAPSAATDVAGNGGRRGSAGGVGSALPFTGAQVLVALLIGLGALGLGVSLRVAGRRH